ncbi:MAG TPA: hypothetical protein VIN93_08705 [Bryobacteraceae bacterium]
MARRLLAASILSVVAAWAQAQPTEPAAGSVAGVVMDALTHAPLAGVPVHADGSTATTDLAGRFAFQRLEPGRHWISVYEERRALSAGVYVLVGAGQEVSGVEIYVKLGGAISGTVVDEDHKPVAGVSVLLMEKRFEFGQVAYDRELTATTGDDGRYRLQPIPAERGYLILVKRPLAVTAAAAEGSAGDGKPQRVLVPTYYPNSPDAQGAQPVTLTPGESREGVDIAIASADSYCIDGRLDVAGGEPPDSFTITEHMSLVTGSTFAPATITTKAEGKFRACGLHPGDYLLAAKSGPSSNPPAERSVSALAEVAITDRDVRDLKLLARAPTVISGDAVWDPPPSGKAADRPVGIGLTNSISFDTQADQAGRPPSMRAMFAFGGKVRVPGPFTLGKVPAAGDYQFRVDDLPEGCYVKEASIGTASVLPGLLRMTGGGAEGRMRLVLACDGGFLTARVADSEGNPVSHVHLYVMPADTPSEAALSTAIRTGEVEKGWSSMTGPLPPGKYLALASELELDGTAGPIAQLWLARSKAKEVEIGPSAVVQVTLEVAGTN